MRKLEEQALGIRELARLSGIAQPTLRAWERRYRAIRPFRTSTGRRRYRASEVDRALMLSRLTAAGTPIGRIASLPSSALEALLRQNETRPLAVAGPGGPADGVERLLALVQTYDLEGLERELAAERGRRKAGAFALEIAAPLLRRIGESVVGRRLGIAQEHAVSAVLRGQLAQAYLASRAASRVSAQLMVFATPEGDLHEFGAMSSAILASEAGLRTLYLGPNLPARDLAAVAIRMEASRVVVSHTSSAYGDHELFDRYLDELLVRLPRGIKVWVGRASPTTRIAADRRVSVVATLEDFARRVRP